AGPVRIEEASIDDRQSVQIVIHVCVELPEHFRDLIWSMKVHGHIVLRERHWRVRAVNPATRRSVDETFNGTLPSMLENFQDPHAIDNEVEFRMVHRVLVREMCRQMVDHLRRLPENGPEDFVVNDVASDEMDPLPFRKIP